MSRILISEGDAAIYLGLSKKTLQMRRFKRLPPVYHKIGRSVRYDVADLDAFLRANRIDLDQQGGSDV